MSLGDIIASASRTRSCLEELGCRWGKRIQEGYVRFLSKHGSYKAPGFQNMDVWNLIVAMGIHTDESEMVGGQEYIGDEFGAYHLFGDEDRFAQKSQAITDGAGLCIKCVWTELFCKAHEA